MPARTSPEPAVASQGGALALIARRPSGAAITVSAPLRSTTAPERALAARARSGFGSGGEVGEEPGELALVRGQHHRGVAGGDGGKERGRIVRPDRQRVGVEQDRRVGGQRRRGERALGCAGAEAGAERDGGDARFGEESGERLGVVDALQHDGGQVVRR